MMNAAENYLAFNTETQTVSVDEGTAADYAAVRAYALAHERSEIFHHPIWDKILREGMRHRVYRLIARRGGKIVGTCGLSYVCSPIFGNRLIATGGFTGGGILADDEAAGAALLEAALVKAEELKADTLELRENFSDNPAFARDDKGVVREHLYAGFVAEIPETPEKILLLPGRKKRADVRKGINNSDLTVDHAASFEEFHKNYAITLRNHGTPAHYKNVYRLIIDTLRTENMVNLTCIRHKSEAIAAVCSFYFKDTIIAYYGGAAPSARHLHAFDYMYYQLMCYAKEKGFRYFDFGRSKVGSGGYAYKTYWNFNPLPLPYRFYPVRSAKLPEINPNNPTYSLPIKIWRKTPAAITDFIGGYVARQIG